MLALTFLLRSYKTYDCISGVAKDETARMALFRF